MALDSALAGMHAGVAFQQAPASRPVQAGDYCQQCCGNLIRVEGRLTCGRCGWPADKELPPRMPQTVGVQSQNDDLRKRQREMEAELAALKVENLALKEAAQASEETDAHVVAKKHKR